jgi:hypothetical protein
LLEVWAANVRGMVATANAIAANKVFFIFSLPAGHCPLTIPSCAGWPFNSIACAGYRSHRNRAYRG